MTTHETCPRCAARFPSRKTLLSGGMWTWYHGLDKTGPAVRCPHCWHVSEARELRLFGILPPRALPWIVAGILAACVVVASVTRHGR